MEVGSGGTCRKTAKQSQPGRSSTDLRQRGEDVLDSNSSNNNSFERIHGDSFDLPLVGSHSKGAELAETNL